MQKEYQEDNFVLQISYEADGMYFCKLLCETHIDRLNERMPHVMYKSVCHSAPLSEFLEWKHYLLHGISMHLCHENNDFVVHKFNFALYRGTSERCIEYMLMLRNDIESLFSQAILDFYPDCTVRRERRRSGKPETLFDQAR